MPMQGWIPQPNKYTKTDPGQIWRTGGTTPSYGNYREPPESPSNVGYTGSSGGDFGTPKTQPSATPWDRWMPYFQGLGLQFNPKGATATSGAFRKRMLPDALQAMKDYFESLGMTWDDYLDYSQGYMPKTPNIGGRQWAPSGLWRR